MKGVVYAKGCGLGTFVLDPPPVIASRIRFDCHKLRTVWLKGVVTGYPQPSELTVRIMYMAPWIHTYFGINDGSVVTFPLVEVVPGPDGKFAVEVPDFANDELMKSFPGQAECSITNWRTGTNDLYWLDADAPHSRMPGSLAFQGHYPEGIKFIPR